MSSQYSLRISDSVLFTLMAGLAGFATAAFAPQIFNDGDTYWHISAGAWMLDHHAVLRADPFSYTFAGAPWTAQEWLSEIVMALTWRAGGWVGLHILFGLAAGATCAILGFALSSRLSRETALVVFVLGVTCVAGNLLARPHLLALPLLAIWTLGLARAREQDRTPSLWLLVVMLVWANLHASFLFGLALAAALAFEAAVELPGRRMLALGGWFKFTLAACAVTLLTPQGVNGLLFPFKLFAMHGMAYIGEWQSASFETISPLEITLLTALFFFATRGIKLPAIRTAILVGLVHFSLRHSRYEVLLGVAGPILLAQPLARELDSRPRIGETQIGAYAALGAALLFVSLVCLRLALPVSRSNDPVSPIAALAHVPSSFRVTPVLNDYAFGGYLIFAGIRPYIDSRADLYGDHFLDVYATIQKPDRAALIATLEHYHIRWTILGTSSPVNATLDTLPGWHRLYDDPIAVVHVRD